MPVLIDIEWIEKRLPKQAPYHKLTQISALRVSSTWKAQARLDLLVRPEAPKECDWSFMAYNGYTPEEFCTGKCEGDCIRGLFGWLEKGEAMFCWHHDSKKVLLEVYRRYIQDKDGSFGGFRFVCLKEHVETILTEQGLSTSGFYDAARKCGADVSAEHCSSFDTELMRQILCKIKKPSSALIKAPVTNVAAAQRKVKNQNIIAKTEYQFVYSPNSKVFHRCDCKLILRAVTIQGSIYYRTAAKSRRPCKICKPVPTAAETAKIEHFEKAAELPDLNEVIKVRLLGGQMEDIKRKNIVGCCHNNIHPGKLTEKLMEKHDCIGKQCRFFEKYENASYWVDRETRRRKKAESKRQKQAQQKKEAASAKTLDALKAEFQGYLDVQGYPMHIVRLDPVKQNVFRVFYVSDHPFADGQLYPNFYAAVGEHYPQYRLLLRHIQDENGRFVTREEYVRRTGSNIYR